MSEGLPHARLEAALMATIAERGPITFRDYMDIALYHPDGGYYTSATRVRQGWGGDYLTSLDIHPLFGAALGRWLGRLWQQLGQPDPFLVREDGASRGWLARDIAAWASDPEGDAPQGFAAALHYQQRDVIPAASGEPSLEDLLVHVVLSNELIDAMPVHVVEHHRTGELAEIYVTVAADGKRLTELAGPPSTLALADYLERYGVGWQAMPTGWRAEINLDAEAWMAQTAARLAPHGAVLTIDYGDLAEHLYIPARTQGTLMAFSQHTIADDPLARTGEQDLTAHVNFSALIAIGAEHALHQATWTTQRDFLLSLGIREDAEQLGQRRFPRAFDARHTDAGQADYLRLASLRHRIATLTDPDGMGGFRVLVQQRDLD